MKVIDVMTTYNDEKYLPNMFDREMFNNREITFCGIPIYV